MMSHREKQEVLEKQSLAQATVFKRQGLVPRSFIHPLLSKALATIATTVTGVEFVSVAKAYDEYSIVGEKGILLHNVQNLQQVSDTNDESYYEKELH